MSSQGGNRSRWASWFAKPHVEPRVGRQTSGAWAGWWPGPSFWWPTGNCSPARNFLRLRPGTPPGEHRGGPDSGWTPGADPVRRAGGAGPCCPRGVSVADKSEFEEARRDSGAAARRSVSISPLALAWALWSVWAVCLSDLLQRTSGPPAGVRHLDGDGLSAPFPAGGGGREASGWRCSAICPAYGVGQGLMPWLRAPQFAVEMNPPERWWVFQPEFLCVHGVSHDGRCAAWRRPNPARIF